MKNVKLQNDFHGTSALVKTTVLDQGLHFEVSLTRSQMERVSRKLCGVKGCACGIRPAGTRGPQEINGKKLIINEFPSDL